MLTQSATPMRGPCTCGFSRASLKTGRLGPVLARVDAWDGCWGLAEKEFLQALSAHPEDSDVRAGLIDLYMWQKRWDEARALIDDGLFLEHDSATLLLRRARLLHFSSPTIRRLSRSCATSGVACPRTTSSGRCATRSSSARHRWGLRYDAYPSSYPSIYTMDAQLVEHWRKFEFDSQLPPRRLGGEDLRPRSSMASGRCVSHTIRGPAYRRDRGWLRQPRCRSAASRGGRGNRDSDWDASRPCSTTTTGRSPGTSLSTS